MTTRFQRRVAVLAVTLLGGVVSIAHAQGAEPLEVTAALPAARATIGTSHSDTSTAEFVVGGLRVILRRNTASDVVAANLFLLGGVQQQTPATEGIETFLLAASERGTAHYSKDALRLAMNRTGSAISIDPGDDWTVFGLRALRTTFDSSWALFSDRLMYPTLDSTEVELVRAQLLSAARQKRLHPDAELRAVADSLLFEGHPYALSTEGTERSLASIRVAALRDYLTKQFVTSRMLLVVVGNVERARLEALIRATLAKLPAGRYNWTPPPPVTSNRRALVVERQPLPTNYIIGYYAGPPATRRRCYRGASSRRFGRSATSATRSMRHSSSARSQRVAYMSRRCRRIRRCGSCAEKSTSCRTTSLTQPGSVDSCSSSSPTTS